MTFSDSKQYQHSRSGSGAGDKILYLLIGGGIGAAAALLFAPKAGVDLRSDIADITRKGYDETLDLAHQLKEQSADLYRSIKEKTDMVYELASEKFSNVQNLPKIAGDLIDGEANKNEVLRHPGPGRKSANIF